jgi:hypothetical protein
LAVVRAGQGGSGGLDDGPAGWLGREGEGAAADELEARSRRIGAVQQVARRTGVDRYD